MIEGTDARSLGVSALIADGCPAILKGIARDVPLVAAGLAGPEHAVSWLKKYDGGRPVTAYVADAATKGRFGYTEGFAALDFERETGSLSGYLDRIVEGIGDPAAPVIYMGSTDIDLYLPGLRAEAALPFGDPELAAHQPLVSIWIGNRTTVSAHFDMSNNIAVTLVGRRRFTLFPPDQGPNLYPGPFDLTPAGQVVSTVDFDAPDFERYPRFAEALAFAEVAEMEPGDALIYPALWWHQVEALEPFNAMINYWWNATPAFMDTPMSTLLHGLLSLRGRPAHEKEGWRTLFDYYVFGDPEQAVAHLPPSAHGSLGPLDAMGARRLRAELLKRINR